MRRGQTVYCLLLVAALTACQSAPPTARIDASSSGAPPASIARIDCDAKLSQADELTRSLVAERVREGNYYAALAQIQSLPAQVPEVAVLRADILRRLKSPESRQWFLAMRERCVSADADHGLGLLAAEAGEPVLAHRYLQLAAKARPSESKFRNDLGFSAMLIGNDQQAEFELRTAFELSPNDRRPGFNLMVLSLLRGDRAAWWGWRDRLAPTEAERLDLLKSCRELLRQRRAAKADSAAVSDTCPINPLS